MEASDILIAEKNGMTKQFTRKQWDNLGTDKYGWELVPETPKEVAPLVESNEPPKQKGRKPKAQ